MTMLPVPEEEWRNLHDTPELIIDLITERNADDYSSEWVESEEVRKLDVNRADLDAFLRQHRIASIKQQIPSWQSVVFYDITDCHLKNSL